MKKAIVSLVLVALCTIGYASTTPGSDPASKSPLKANEVYLPVGNTGQLISLMELSQISVKDFEKLSGKKMKFGDKIKFKLGQRDLKKNINEDGTFNSKKFDNYLESQSQSKRLLGINWAGLALGLFLSLIGVLIAYLLSGENKQNMIKWAWIGAIISLIVWGAVLI